MQILFAEVRTALNLPYWQEIDRRMTYALENYPHVIFKLIPYGEDTEEIRRYDTGDRARWSDIITLESIDEVGGGIILAYREVGNQPVINDEDRYENHRNPKHDRYFFRRLMWASLFSGGSATYGGSWGVVMEFIHECGHGFMYYCLADDKRFEYLPTAEAHEIHGMSLVSLAYPWMELFFEDGADICRYNKYFGKIYGLVFFCCLDEFEYFVYNNPTCGPQERNRFWIHLEKKYQLKRDVAGSPNETGEGRGWQEWEVIFSLPFYSIGYALSEVAAQQFWTKAASDRDEAISDYVNLCKASASKLFFNLLKVGKLKSPFQQGLLEELVEYGRGWTRKIRRAVE